VERKQGQWVLLACCALSSLTGACGGESSHQGSTGGAGGDGSGATGGTTGSGGTSGSGGSSSFMSPPAVGLSLTLGPPDVASVPNLGSRSCHAGNFSGFTYVIGAPSPGRTLEDGTDGVTLECMVNGDGTFSASGSGIDGNGKKPMSFSFAGHIHDKVNAVANPGDMTFFSPDTLMLGNLESDPRCSFGPVTTLKKGALLTDVDCPLIGSVDDTTSGCSVKGTIAFEYCKTDADTP
jgi:hypothetical protein